MAGRTKPEDYLSFLQQLDQAGQPYFLEGGQAVNFWAEYFSTREAGGALRDFQPFTSKDCDIWVDGTVLHYLAENRRGALVRGTSPADGQLGVFTLDGEPPLLVDLMSGVYGIPPRNNARLAQRALNIDGVRVIDPPHLLKSKCCCLMDLDQTGRQDERHLRILCHILPLYFLELLRAAQEGEISERALIREIKLMIKISSFQRCHRALERIEVSADSLFPVKELASSGLPVLKRFVKTSLSGGADLPPP